MNIFPVISIIIIILGYYFLYKKYSSFFMFKNKIINIFLILSLIFSFLAFFGYQTNFKRNISLENSNIIFVLDVSKSMLALDYGDYSRLDIAKEFIKEFILKNPNNKYALTVFAGDTTNIIPFTLDKELFFTFLDNVDEKSILTGGSDFYNSIKNASSRFIDDIQGGGIVLLSDFEPTDNNGNLSSLDKKSILENLGGLNKNISQKDIRFYTIGFGSTNGNKIINKEALSNTNFLGETNYIKNDFGKEVITKLDIGFLDKITKIFNGESFLVSKIEDIKNVKFQNLPTSQNDINIDIKIDFSRYIIILAYILFIIFLSLFYYFDKKGK